MNDDMVAGSQDRNRNRRGHRGGTGPDRTDESYTGHGQPASQGRRPSKAPRPRCPYCSHRQCKACVCCSLGRTP